MKNNSIYLMFRLNFSRHLLFCIFILNGCNSNAEFDKHIWTHDKDHRMSMGKGIQSNILKRGLPMDSLYITLGNPDYKGFRVILPDSVLKNSKLLKLSKNQLDNIFSKQGRKKYIVSYYLGKSYQDVMYLNISIKDNKVDDSWIGE